MNNSKTFHDGNEKTIVVISVLFIIALPWCIYDYEEYLTLIITTLLTSFSALMLVYFWEKPAFLLRQADVIMIGIGIYTLMNVALVRNFQIDRLVYFEWITMGAIYVIVRCLPANFIIWILCGIFLSGLIQSFMGLLQSYRLLPSLGENFSVSGCFYNPGPYGGYLALAVTAGVCILVQMKRNIWKKGVLAGILFTGYMLILSESRAAWLAVILSSLFVSWYYFPDKFTKLMKHWKRCTLFIVFLILLFLGLYYYKQESANIRLLIWTVSSKLFAESPIIGNGIGSFPIRYMDMQADYFFKYPDSIFRTIADNNTQAFNEYVTIACEQGIIGLFIYVLLLFTIFRKGSNRLVKYLLVSLCLFACFSYPTSVFPLKCMFPLIVGLDAGNAIYNFKRKKKIFYPLALVGWGMILCWSIITYHYYDRAYSELYTESPELILKYNKKYMSQYARQLFEKQDNITFINVVENEGFPFMTSQLRCDLGIARAKIGDIKQALKDLQQANAMAPSKVLPKYLLFCLYTHNGDTLQASAKAKEILQMHPKKIGSVYLKARKEAKIFIHSIKAKES